MRNILYTECGRRAREARAFTLDRPPIEAAAPTQIDRITCNELTAAIRRLPRNQRIAITLAVLEDLSSEEIAARMQISPNAVRSHLLRGRKQLRDFAAALPDRRPRHAVDRSRSIG
jgi:RNA polymerase sigma-70 factor (ECF subfamily)